jgi:hypothetical protein
MEGVGVADTAVRRRQVEHVVAVQSPPRRCERGQEAAGNAGTGAEPQARALRDPPVRFVFPGLGRSPTTPETLVVTGGSTVAGCCFDHLQPPASERPHNLSHRARARGAAPAPASPTAPYPLWHQRGGSELPRRALHGAGGRQCLQPRCPSLACHDLMVVMVMVVCRPRSRRRQDGYWCATPASIYWWCYVVL